MESKGEEVWPIGGRSLVRTELEEEKRERKGNVAPGRDKAPGGGPNVLNSAGVMPTRQGM